MFRDIKILFCTSPPEEIPHRREISPGEIALRLLADQRFQLDGIVRRNEIHAQVEHRLHILLLVDGPDVDLQPEVVRLLHPFGVLFDDFQAVIQSVHAGLLQLGGRLFSVEVVDYVSARRCSS